MSPYYLFLNFTKSLHDFSEYVEVTSAATSRAWRLPVAWAKKINSDAHLAARNQMGLGAVLRNDAVCIVAATIKRLRARWSVKQAEIAAARLGVLLAGQLGYAKVELECHASNVGYLEELIGYGCNLLS